MKGFLIDLEFTWGFQARVVGMSKTSPSFQLPPPTTMLGAIAEAYSRRRGLSEYRSYETIQGLAEKTVVLAYKLVNVIPIAYQDLNRIVAVRFSGGISYPSTKDPYGSFDAPARGKTILSSIDGGPPTMRVFCVFRDDSEITKDDLWRIRRVGSRESLVSVLNVIESSPEVLRPETLKDGVVETDYLLPLTYEIEKSIINIGDGLIQMFVPLKSLAPGYTPPKLYLENKVLKHVISMPITNKLKVKLPRGYVGYKIEDEVAVGLES
ncbi:MAG: type I-A CRISPR-associated protein Cas5a [Sulfolobales archaeon]